MFQAEVSAISEVAKNVLTKKMHNQTIVALLDSQAAIKSLIKCTVTLITVFNCIRNLNQLDKQNHVSTAWIPGLAGVYGNEVSDYVAKSGSKSKIHGPEPFITVRYASCVNTVKDWSTDRWKSMRNERKDGLRMKESGGWTSSRLTIRGGVEDTRLEAKAKDTKKIRGQGQPFRGQTLSRPRTGMLEAKDTAASVPPQKKSLHKIFFRQSPIYRRGQNF